MVPTQRLSSFADEVITLASVPDSVDPRLVSALLSRALARSSPDAFAKVANDMCPVAFVGRFEDDVAVAKLNGEAWEEGSGGGTGAVR